MTLAVTLAVTLWHLCCAACAGRLKLNHRNDLETCSPPAKRAHVINHGRKGKPRRPHFDWVKRARLPWPRRPRLRDALGRGAEALVKCNLLNIMSSAQSDCSWLQTTTPLVKCSSFEPPACNKNRRSAFLRASRPAKKREPPDDARSVFLVLCMG